MSSKKFSAFTGDAAEISSEPGGSFTGFGGRIVGRNIELIPSKRIVQAWRSTTWESGVYSIVRFELQGEGSETRLIMDHTGFPDDQREHLESGWNMRYWEPLKKYLS